MKSNFVLLTLLAFGLGCAQTSVKQQTVKMSTEKKKQPVVVASPNLDDYVGIWKVEKETYGCFPVKIEKSPVKDTVKITRKSSMTTISKDSPFDSVPENTMSDYPGYKLSTSTLSKFIRGKIISGHIWSPDTKDWLGVGLRTWTLEKGALIKKKAGLTVQGKSNKAPKENNVFDIDKDDVMIRWEVECKYVKSS